MFMGDTAKVTLEGDGSTTRFPNNVLYSKYESDLRFSAFSGLWTNIMAVAAVSPTNQQIKRVSFLNSATSQSNALTLSGTSGTATILFKGVSKVATFATDLTTTAANFVTANAAAYAAVGVTLTSAAAVLTFVNDEEGVVIDAATGINLTTDLAGANVTTAAVAATSLANNDAQTLMKSAWDARPAIMRTMAKKDLVYLVTSDLWDNYEDTLQGNGTIVVDSQRSAGINGIAENQMIANGIEMVQMPLDSVIDAYFGGYAPSRVILTLRSNIAPIYSTSNSTADMALWFEKKDNANLSRIQGEFGMNLWLPEYMVVVY